MRIRIRIIFRNMKYVGILKAEVGVRRSSITCVLQTRIMVIEIFKESKFQFFPKNKLEILKT